MKKHTPRKMSNDLIYETFGREAFVLVIKVVCVNTVVTPMVTLARN